MQPEEQDQNGNLFRSKMLERLKKKEKNTSLVIYQKGKKKQEKLFYCNTFYCSFNLVTLLSLHVATGAKSSARVVVARYPVELVFVDPPRIERTLRPSPLSLLRRSPTAVTVLLRVARCRVKNNILPDIYSNSEGVRGRETFEKEQPQPRRGGGGRSIQ